MRIAGTTLAILVLGTMAFGQAVTSPAAPTPSAAPSIVPEAPAPPAPPPARRPNPFAPATRPPTPGADAVEPEPTTPSAPTPAADKKPAMPVLVGVVAMGDSVLAAFAIADVLWIARPGDSTADMSLQFVAYKDEQAVLKHRAGDTITMGLTIRPPDAPPKTTAPAAPMD